jgi:hypothetical protein
MKPVTIMTVAAAVLWSGAAAADPFRSCEDALNYGANVARFYVSAIYNKAACDRTRATESEDAIFKILPTYWAKEATLTTPEKAACLLQGAFSSWMDTIKKEYADCSSAAGFTTIQRKLLGVVAGSLFDAFYWNAMDYYTVDVVRSKLAYDFSKWPLDGRVDECKATIDKEAPGVPVELLETLKSLVCV